MEYDEWLTLVKQTESSQKYRHYIITQILSNLRHITCVSKTDITFEINT